MRLSSLLTLACAIVAFVLSMLCIFAGSTEDLLQDSDLLTLNISRLGHTELFDTNDGDGGLLDNFINDIQEEVNDLISDVTSDIAEALNLSDFYSVHVMNFCEGQYAPNGTARDASKNVTDCSRRTTSFSFEPTRIIGDQLPAGITLEDLHWPQRIEDAERSIRVASLAMLVLYCIGVGFAGIAILTAIWGIFSDGRVSALVNLVIDVLAFVAIGVASALATAVIVMIVNAVNDFGNDIGISATMGGRFLGMTWAATGVMLLATATSITQCCVGRKRSKRYTEKGSYSS